VNDDAEVKKLCLSERQARSAAAASAAKTGQPRLPPELASSGGRTPEMRMGAAILESYELKLQGTHVSLARLRLALLCDTPAGPLPLVTPPAAASSRTSINILALIATHPPACLVCVPPLSSAAPPCPTCLQSSLKEELETIEQTRTVWHMQLDHQRNRVLRVNLLIR
jgi:hypothetical protein